MVKLEPGPTGQLGAKGNVCIFPQEPGPLTNCLPPPLSQIHDEVCVILVFSLNIPITLDMLTKTPLLLRRKKIIHALRWLKDNNPLCHDIDMDEVCHNAREYPEHGVEIALESIV